MRKFDKNSYEEKIVILSSIYVMALRESDEMKKKWRTDIYGVATQYGKVYGVAKSDFDLIKNMTIDEISKNSMVKNNN